MDIEYELNDLLFGVRRSVRYHNLRRMFFERLGLFKNAITVILGSAAVYGVVGQLGDCGKVISIVSGLFVTVLATIDLVIGSSRAARLHSDLARRFIVLEKKIELQSDPTEDMIRQWKGERLEIEMEEPPVLRVLDTLCHNEMVRAMGYSKTELKSVKWYQRWFAQYVDLCAHNLGWDSPDPGKAITAGH